MIILFFNEYKAINFDFELDIAFNVMHIPLNKYDDLFYDNFFKNDFVLYIFDNKEYWEKVKYKEYLLNRFDYMISSKFNDILNNYYKLTGHQNKNINIQHVKSIEYQDKLIYNKISYKFELIYFYYETMYTVNFFIKNNRLNLDKLNDFCYYLKNTTISNFNYCIFEVNKDIYKIQKVKKYKNIIILEEKDDIKLQIIKNIDNYLVYVEEIHFYLKSKFKKLYKFLNIQNKIKILKKWETMKFKITNYILIDEFFLNIKNLKQLFEYNLVKKNIGVCKGIIKDLNKEFNMISKTLANKYIIFNYFEILLLILIFILLILQIKKIYLNIKGKNNLI